WLFKHNPEINWQTGVVTLSCCPQECVNLGKPNHVRHNERLEKINAGHVYELRSLEKIDEDDDEVKPEEEIKRLVPPEYHDFWKVFSKHKSERFPEAKPWDHAIDLKDTFKPRKGHMIPLSAPERDEVSSFIDEQLRKGYIRSSKSPMTSPVFFIPKKDGKKCMIIDYCYVNQHTVKNAY
ncbi:hypothetical protein SERLA73DRAFT_37725, partial [Serpula lacrymans var. lacrymans S7.3]